jgi:hypothetical protein
MNPPKIPSTREGTISGVAHLAWPWPGTHPEFMYRVQLENGHIELISDQHGRIIGRMFLIGSDNPLLEVVTCPLVLSEPSAISLCVVWTTTTLEIFVNAEMVGSTKSPNEVPKEYRVQMNRSAIRYDFSKENEAAIATRRDRLAGHGGMPLQRGRQRSTRDGVFHALQDEIIQIDGLFELIKKGAFQHAVGLSGIARKMIAVGSPLPLVQLSAAFIDAPLIVYTAAGGRRVLPRDIPPPTNYLVFSARSRPELLYENPVDLDVWLDTYAGEVAGEHFTHRELIKKIGDTLGSHFDMDVHPSVPALRGSRSATPAGNVDFLIQYVCNAAGLAHHLGLQILEKTK